MNNFSPIVPPAFGSANVISCNHRIAAFKAITNSNLNQ
jgi:hypothetical protein